MSEKARALDLIKIQRLQFDLDEILDQENIRKSPNSLFHHQKTLDWLFGINSIAMSPLNKVALKLRLDFEDGFVRKQSLKPFLKEGHFLKLYGIKSFQQKQIKKLLENETPLKSTRHRNSRFSGVCIWTDDKELFLKAYPGLVDQLKARNVPVLFRILDQSLKEPNVFCDLHIWWCDQVDLCGKIGKLPKNIFSDYCVLIWSWPFTKFHEGFQSVLPNFDEIWSPNLEVCQRLSTEHRKLIERLPSSGGHQYRQPIRFQEVKHSKILLGFQVERHLYAFLEQLLAPQVKAIKEQNSSARITVLLDISRLKISDAEMKQTIAMVKQMKVQCILRKTKHEPVEDLEKWDLYVNANLTDAFDPYLLYAKSLGKPLVQLEEFSKVRRIGLKNPLLQNIDVRVFDGKRKKSSFTVRAPIADSPFEYNRILDRLFWNL